MARDPTLVLEEWLVVSARAGSRASFAELVRRWTPRLLRHANRLIVDPDAAEDIVQEGWISIARNLRRLDDPARFPGWAFAIVTRRAADQIRRAIRERRAMAHAGDRSQSGSSGAELADDARLDLLAALQRLPFDQRLIVSLHYGEGLMVEEIAAAHDLPAGTVKSRLFAARQSLKAFLEGAET